ncbi:P-type DNA transfer ATPase VirB11 [Steroidobacter agaridevorans]|nr:P-type DNA transfer ATPase VirB11 [Steroidobacter agaridevorans]
MEATEVPIRRTALDLTLQPLRPLLDRPATTELCLNRPFEAYVETYAGWHREPLPWATYEWCRSVAKLVANASRQRVDEHAPLLSASLPTGERIQFVLPPATSPGTVAITVRRPSSQVWALDDLDRRGVFRGTKCASPELDETERELKALLRTQNIEAFLRLAMRARKNILVSGATGAGKTTVTKALILEIAHEERLITIEDAPELPLTRHPNHVQLFYSRGDQGTARVSPQQLVQASLRMRPDRILLAELRGEEALDYLRQVNSGHPGSITSVHAASAALAFEAMALLVKQSPGGRELSRADIKTLLAQTVDIVLQCDREPGRRFVSEVWYEPEAKRNALATASVA